MLTVDLPLDLGRHTGKVLGASAWFTVTQEAIEGFAKISGDDHWIHVDVDRASRDMPGGRTIAHGLYLLSLIPMLQRDIYTIRNRGRGLNYGYDRVRFLASVPVNSRIRLRQTLVECIEHARGVRITLDSEIQNEGGERPALVARGILVIEDK